MVGDSKLITCRALLLGELSCQDFIHVFPLPLSEALAICFITVIHGIHNSIPIVVEIRVVIVDITPPTTHCPRLTQGFADAGHYSSVFRLWQNQPQSTGLCQNSASWKLKRITYSDRDADPPA